MFSNPKSNLEQLGLSKGMRVADLGVGSGFYALEAAKIVGEEGRVFGVDVQKELVETVKKLAEKNELSNVEVIWGDIEKDGGTKIKEGIIDVVIASNILFQVENKESFAKEIERILKSGGRVLVVDWLDSFAGLGPHKDEVVTEERAKSLFCGAGFSIEKSIDAGDHHYGFVALKA
ncbi:MAG TPA: class I SAM-dependent methyltransferase [Candidatus Paceibacterota bacterium]